MYNTFYKKCRHLFGGINYHSVFKIALFILPIIIVFQLLLTSGSAHYQKKVVTQQAIQLSAISSLESPTEMVPGIINSDTRYVINSTSDITSKILSENSKLLCPAGMSISVRYLYACHITKSDLGAMETRLQEYSSLLNTVLDFMEYNPEVDFTNYSPGATNTTQRIEFFKEGVNNTTEAIEELHFNNDTTSEIKDLLFRSLETIDKLENSGDVVEFTNDITETQNQIIILLKQEYIQATNTSRQASINILKRFN
jgi:hypothetical protein